MTVIENVKQADLTEWTDMIERTLTFCERHKDKTREERAALAVREGLITPADAQRMFCYPLPE